uniref:Peptidyl-tRNA hydrolase 1 homolog n=1 Tax=Cyprinodon variegatus TaxID=28743 RepID=A0A3Q2DPB9_CYPVA
MEGTRHSVGMAVLGALAARLGMANRWRGDSHVSGEVILTEVQHTRVVLLRPRLLMNINGVSVAKAAGKYGIKPEDVLLVHDEMDKPLGKIAIKHGGSASTCAVMLINESCFTSTATLPYVTVHVRLIHPSLSKLGAKLYSSPLWSVGSWPGQHPQLQSHQTGKER